MLLISREEAKLKGLKYFFTGIPCNQGHLSKRLVSKGECCECKSAYRKKYDPTGEKRKFYLENNPEQIIKDRERKIRYRKINRDKIRLKDKKYRKENPGIKNAQNALRRARKLHATPNWLTKDDKTKITEIYKKASELSTDLKCFHVDHDIPLIAKTKINDEYIHIACGLHVPWNLNIVEGEENLSKNCYIDI